MANLLNAAQYTHVIASTCMSLYGYAGEGSEAYWISVALQIGVLVACLVITLVGAVLYAKSLKISFYIFCLSMFVGISSFAYHRDIDLVPRDKCFNGNLIL